MQLTLEELFLLNHLFHSHESPYFPHDITLTFYSFLNSKGLA